VRSPLGFGNQERLGEGKTPPPERTKNKGEKRRNPNYLQTVPETCSGIYLKKGILVFKPLSVEETSCRRPKGNSSREFAETDGRVLPLEGERSDSHIWLF